MTSTDHLRGDLEIIKRLDSYRKRADVADVDDATFGASARLGRVILCGFRLFSNVFSPPFPAEP